MAISSKNTMWVLVIFGLISLGSLNVKAQSPAAAPQMSVSPGPGAAAPAPDCMTQLYNMTDCLTFVEKGSNLTKPDKPCCPEVAGLLDSNPICLCELLGKSKDFGLELDLSRALKLPKFCKLQAPDVSLCSVAGYPVAGLAPAGAPASSLGPSSHVASSPGGMSPEAGGTTGGKNGASSAHFNVAYLVAGLTMAFTLLKF